MEWQLVVGVSSVCFRSTDFTEEGIKVILKYSKKTLFSLPLHVPGFSTERDEDSGVGSATDQRRSILLQGPVKS